MSRTIPVLISNLFANFDDLRIHVSGWVSDVVHRKRWRDLFENFGVGEVIESSMTPGMPGNLSVEVHLHAEDFLPGAELLMLLAHIKEVIPADMIANDKESYLLAFEDVAVLVDAAVDAIKGEMFSTVDDLFSRIVIGTEGPIADVMK